MTHQAGIESACFWGSEIAFRYADAIDIAGPNIGELALPSGWPGHRKERNVS